MPILKAEVIKKPRKTYRCGECRFSIAEIPYMYVYGAAEGEKPYPTRLHLDCAEKLHWDHPKIENAFYLYQQSLLMKPYIAFSLSAGPWEGASLVVDYSIIDARKLAWEFNLPFINDFLDLRLQYFGDRLMLHLADRDKLAQGKPHVVESPIGCQSCGYWGVYPTKDGRCSECDGNLGERYLSLFENEVKYAK